MKNLKKNTTTLSLSPQSNKQILSPIKVKFNSLIKNIEKKRAKLKALHDIIPIYQQLNDTEFKPLHAQFQALQAQIIIQLDDHYQNVKLSKKEKNNLFDCIFSFSDSYISNTFEPDVKVKDIYNRYHQTDYDQEKEKEDAYNKKRLEEMFGSEIEGDVDFSDMDSILKLMADKMQILAEEEMAKEQPQRKKTAKQLEKEAKLNEHQDKISQSIQSVYRQLTSALHPDRESDPDERIRKTELMQRVTIAYKEKNLLDLLTLQLEETKIDQNALDTLSEEKIKHYNQVLQSQSKELTFEIKETEEMFRLKFMIRTDESMSPKMLINNIKIKIHNIAIDCIELEKITKSLKDPQGMKVWLQKEYA